jgi:uncharacterized GH25 family protein
MKKAILAVFCIVIAGGLWAHEFFVIPDAVKDYRSGDTVNLELYSTHYFMTGEELEAPETNEVFVLQGGRVTPVPLRADAAKTIYTGTYRLEGDAPAVVLSNRKVIFYSTTTRGSQEGSRPNVSARGFTVTKTSWNEKWCKTYINPSANDRSFAVPLGLTLEIVPVSNPADIALGRPAVFRVLYRGQPLRNVPVNATYQQYNARDQEAYAVQTTSDANGQVTITPNARGIWMIQVGHVAAVSGNPNYDEESLRSIVVFTVK